jgi:GNAT superfamily N-acetyltransferase
MEAVRLARADDAVACHALLTDALAAVRHQRGGAALAGPIGASDLLSGWLAPSQPEAGALFVGEFGGVVVVLLALSTFTRPGQDARSGRVECVYVEDQARGVGVGSALMEAAVAWCVEHQCADMDARALPGDRASKQRLEAAGFTARLLILNRRLR